MANLTTSVSSNFSTLATDPLRNFKFLVKIHHTVPHVKKTLMYLGFTSVSGLSMTTESIPYRQGSYNTTVHQIPGQSTFTPITLQRGVLVGQHSPWEWMKELFSVIAGQGNGRPGNNFRCNVDISVLAHPVTLSPLDQPSGNVNSVFVPTLMKFRVHNAWITSISYSDLNAGDNALVVEQMTLVHEGFDCTVSDSPSADAVDPD